MNPPTPVSSASQPLPPPLTMEEARGKPSFLKWRAKIENAKGMEDVNERTFTYGGCKFVWGGDNQEDKERRLLIRIITMTNNNSEKKAKN
jgi:hypothetical protein